MSYERNQMISLLYRIFQAERYFWIDKNGERNMPTYENIDETLNKLEADAEKCKGFAETGRLRVEYDKEGQCFDYYFNLGHS